MTKEQPVHSGDRCEIEQFDPIKVERVRQSIQSIDMESTSQLFKALADPNRLKIVYALAKEDEVCVCDVAHILGSTVATASHHLRLLRNMGLAKQRKEGKMVFYSLDHDLIPDLIHFVLNASEERR